MLLQLDKMDLSRFNLPPIDPTKLPKLPSLEQVSFGGNNLLLLGVQTWHGKSQGGGAGAGGGGGGDCET